MQEIIRFAPVAIIVILLLILIAAGYVKAPPDQAYIISGMRREGRVLIGRAGLRIPFFERLDKLYLGQMTVDIKTEQSVPTNDFINVNVDAVAKVRISPTEEGIRLAAKNFLNKRSADITEDLKDSLQGNMREIIGTLSLKSINTDRDSFSDQVMSKASRDIAIAQAEANKASNEAEVASEQEIAQRNNDLAIKKAGLQVEADTKKAIADAAYEIQKQEQQKTIEAATVNAQIAKAEREAELRAKEVDVKQKTLDAEIRAQADAERYRQQQEAEADLFRRQKDAEAKKYEQEQSALAMRAQAEAAKFAREQEAEGIKAVGEAEAAAIRAKAVAEAEGIDRKAEAMKKYGEAAVIEMVMNALPEIAKNVAEPLSKVDHITMYGEGNSAKLLQDIVNGTTQVTEGISHSMGIDFKSLVAGMVGGKMMADGKAAPQVIVQTNVPQSETEQEMSKNKD